MDDKMIVIGLLIIVIIIMLMYGSRNSSAPHKQHKERKKILPGVPTPHQNILPGVPTPPKEGFENYGILPNVEADVLLQDWYPVHQPKPSFSDLTQEQQYHNYPAFKANSKYNNNIQYWRKPNNAQCSPGGICGNFYDFKKTEIPPPAPCPGFSHSRVNYYDGKR
jgi:hypothetical protein